MKGMIRFLLVAALGALATAAEPGREGGAPPARGPRGPAADDHGHGMRHGPGSGRPDAEAWRRLDRDGNGAVSYDEFAANPRLERLPDERKREIFGRLDKNGDGAIQPAEMEPADGPEDRPHGPLPLRELDRNHDGVIDFAEFASGRFVARLPEDKRRAMFGRMDRDGNGVLDGRDRPESMPGPFPRLAELDKDGSGGVSFAEFSAGEMGSKVPEERRRALFDRLDRDGDGEIRPGEGMKRGGGGERRGGPPPEGARGPSGFEALDRNRDGVLGFDEFRGWPAVAQLDEDAQEDRFEELDANDDLKLDKSEINLEPKPGEERVGAVVRPGAERQ